MFPVPPFAVSRLLQVVLISFLLLGTVLAVKSYLDGVYEKGHAAGVAAENQVWTERENKRVAEEDKRIDALENAAKDSAEAYKAAMTLAEQKIELLNKKLKTTEDLNKVLYTKTGEKKQCPAGTEIYLGIEFSTLWNQYNEVLK